MPLPSGRSDVVGQEEVLQRSVISDKQIFKEQGLPRPALLMPHTHVELSVSRVDGLSEDEAMELADQVAVKRGKTESRGYAEFSTLAVTEEGLWVEPDEFRDDGNHLLHHANIKGWPEDSNLPEQKAKQLLIAKRLVPKCKLVRK